MKTKHKLIILVIILLLLIGIYFLVFLLPKNYEINYIINDWNIIEKYDKEKGILSISIDEYNYETDYKYSNNRHLIKNANIENGCLYAESDYIKIPYICKEGNNYKIAIQEKNNTIIDNYQNVEIYSYDFNYLFWNYSHFIYIAEHNNKVLDLFDKEFYQLDLIMQIDNNVILPDYNESYYFEKLYLINLKNAKVSNISLSDKIHFDAYFLGEYDKKAYIYDANDKKEYMINPNNGKAKEVNLGIYQDNRFVEISSNKLDKKDVFMETDDSFYLDNNSLYFKSFNNQYKLMNNVSKIVKIDQSKVFFIKDGYLYYLDIFGQYQKLLKYSEWNFNSKNIYVQ